MPSVVLTDGATFTCHHGGTGTVTTGISISALAENVTIGAHKPILAGANITGFTLASGCTFQVSGASTPCVGFTLPAPSEQTLTIGGQPVYTAADAATIALVQSSGNQQPGLSNLFCGIRNKLLPAETRIYGHDQQHISQTEHMLDSRNRSRWIQ